MKYFFDVDSELICRDLTGSLCSGSSTVMTGASNMSAKFIMKIESHGGSVSNIYDFQNWK